jgi:hypothetical protein
LSTNLRKAAWLDLLPGETDLDDRHEPVAADVAHCDDILLATIKLEISLAGKASFGSGNDDATVVGRGPVAARVLVVLVQIVSRSGL